MNLYLNNVSWYAGLIKVNQNLPKYCSYIMIYYISVWMFNWLRKKSYFCQLFIYIMISLPTNGTKVMMNNRSIYIYLTIFIAKISLLSSSIGTLLESHTLSSWQRMVFISYSSLYTQLYSLQHDPLL